jgi:hypothetical protein
MLLQRGDSIFMTDGSVEVRKRGKAIGAIPSRDAILLPFR